MEDCKWIEAAVKVLVRASHPMHYADIKRVILEMGLVPSKWVCNIVWKTYSCQLLQLRCC